MPIYALDQFRPVLPASGRYFIAPEAVLVGRVRIEEDVTVWFGAVLRGDNEEILVKARSNIQDGCVMHTDPGFPLTIAEGCTIGHGAVLHGCTVGENSLIGMGAIVLNGARIGKNSIVGANTLVTEGKEFPDNSLIVGTPARIVRALDDKAVEFLRSAAQIYCDRGERYRKEFKRID